MVKRVCLPCLLSFLSVIEGFCYYGEVSEKELRSAFIDSFGTERVDEFMEGIQNVKQELLLDLDFFLASDPAVDSKEEVVACYPGYRAISYYRFAHLLRNLGYLLPSRMISEIAHEKTGIDIHPGANILAPFFIDHGTGIVIGETTQIGKNVKIYQGVTLGALSLSKGSQMKGMKRHPSVGNNVTIYANASILGPIDVGDNVTIGGNVFLTEGVRSNTKVILDKPEFIVLPKVDKK